MTSSPKTPAAILYAPALNEPAGSGALDGVAQRFARALDHHVDPIPVEYTVREAAREPYGLGDATAEVREIVRHSPGGAALVTHRVYHLAYHASLDDRAAAGNVFVQTWSIFRQWLRMTLRFAGFVVRADALTRTQKTAVFAGGACLLAITLYAVLLVGSAFYFVLTLRETGSVEAPDSIAALLRPVEENLDALFGPWWMKLLAIAGLFGLTFARVRTALESSVQTYLRFGRYTESAAARAECTGRFNDLLEHVLAKAPSRLDIVSYSLGSLVALDALFPNDGGPAPRARHVASLTTIGCPFDLVRTFWPDYFSGRTVSAPGLRWINVYSPVDLLGSNFANEGGVVDDAQCGINAAAPRKPLMGETPGGESFKPAVNLYYDPAGRKALGWADVLLFSAYEAHAQYWVTGRPDAESCYKKFVPLIYAVEHRPDAPPPVRVPAAGFSIVAAR